MTITFIEHAGIRGKKNCQIAHKASDAEIEPGRSMSTSQAGDDGPKSNYLNLTKSIGVWHSC